MVHIYVYMYIKGNSVFRFESGLADVWIWRLRSCTVDLIRDNE